MITIDTAIQNVNKQLALLSKEVHEDIIINELETIVKDNYWVFFYNSKMYLETGNLSYALIGNAPIIVDKIYGQLYETGTAHPTQVYMDEFEKKVLPNLFL